MCFWLAVFGRRARYYTGQGQRGLSWGWTKLTTGELPKSKFRSRVRVACVHSPLPHPFLLLLLLLLPRAPAEQVPERKLFLLLQHAKPRGGSERAREMLRERDKEGKRERERATESCSIKDMGKHLCTPLPPSPFPTGICIMSCLTVKHAK